MRAVHRSCGKRRKARDPLERIRLENFDPFHRGRVNRRQSALRFRLVLPFALREFRHDVRKIS